MGRNSEFPNLTLSLSVKPIPERYWWWQCHLFRVAFAKTDIKAQANNDVRIRCCRIRQQRSCRIRHWKMTSTSSDDNIHASLGNDEMSSDMLVCIGLYTSCLIIEHHVLAKYTIPIWMTIITFNLNTLKARALNSMTTPESFNFLLQTI